MRAYVHACVSACVYGFSLQLYIVCSVYYIYVVELLTLFPLSIVCTHLLCIVYCFHSAARLMNGYSTSVYLLGKQNGIHSCYILIILPLNIVCTLIQLVVVHITPTA